MKGQDGVWVVSLLLSIVVVCATIVFLVHRGREHEYRMHKAGFEMVPVLGTTRWYFRRRGETEAK